MKRIGFACKWIDNASQVNGIKPKDDCKKYNTGSTTVAWLNRQSKDVAVEKQAERYRREMANNGTVSEGLIISNMLDQMIDKIKVNNDLKSVKLPITPKERGEFIKSLPQTKETNYRYSWLHETNNTNKVTIDHPFI